MNDSTLVPRRIVGAMAFWLTALVALHAGLSIWAACGCALGAEWGLRALCVAGTRRGGLSDVEA